MRGRLPIFISLLFIVIVINSNEKINRRFITLRYGKVLLHTCIQNSFVGIFMTMNIK